MKVLHVLNELKLSGAELLLASAAEQFMGRGNRHIILATGPAEGEFAGELRQRGYGIFHRPFRKSPYYLLKLWQTVRDGGYDVVHIHCERAFFWLALAARLAGSHCVRSIHSEFAFGGYLRFRRMVQRRIASFLGVRFVASSPRVAANEKKRFGIESVTISNWFDPQRVTQATADSRKSARAALDVDNQQFVLISIGNYSPVKNQESIIDAVRLCAAAEVPITYLHCGAGGAELAAIKCVIEDEPIQFLGAVTDISDYLAASDAFVNASFYEGGPIALLEAAATGVACITTSVGLAADLAGLPNVTMIEPTAQSIANALQHVARIALAKRLEEGSELSRIVRDRFSAKKGAQAYLEQYATIIKPRKRRTIPTEQLSGTKNL